MLFFDLPVIVTLAFNVRQDFASKHSQMKVLLALTELQIYHRPNKLYIHINTFQVSFDSYVLVNKNFELNVGSVKIKFTLRHV